MEGRDFKDIAFMVANVQMYERFKCEMGSDTMKLKLYNDKVGCIYLGLDKKTLTRKAEPNRTVIR